MPSRRRSLLFRTVAPAAAVALVGCAQLESNSVVEIMPRPDAAPLVLGPPGGAVTARGLAAEWTQDGDRLELRLSETRTCASVRHVPVVRVERIDRKVAGGAMWWEYGLGTGTLAVGLAGLIRPEAFSQASINTNGEVIRDTGTGYRIGGIFTGIGVVLLTAAVIDTVRSRDEVLYTDAYRYEQGGTIECRDPRVPLTGQTVELLVDQWSTVEPTDAAGNVRFLLPGVDDLPESARAVIEATATWEAQRAAWEASEAERQEAEAAAANAEADKVTSRRRGKKGKGVGKAAAGKAAAGKAAAGNKGAGKAAAGNKGAGKSSRPSQGERGSGSRPGGAEDEASKGGEPDSTGADAGPSSVASSPGARPEPLTVRGVLRIDKSRALAIDFVVPYGADAAREHTGRGDVEPGPAVAPPSTPPDPAP